LNSLRYSDAALIGASSIIDANWEWICGGSETTRASSVLRASGLHEFAQMASESPDDFVMDDSFKIVLMRSNPPEVQIHQVNSEHLWFSDDHEDGGSCFRLAQATFVRHRPRKGDDPRPWFLFSGREG
jgi:hypothetical protein